jgi:exodeoxyribonuclease VII large subunit
VSNPSTPDEPFPVREVAAHLKDWIGRLGEVWVLGQVTELKRRPGASMVFLSLRDPQSEASLSVVTTPGVLDALETPLVEGAAVVVLGKPEFWPKGGKLMLRGKQIRPVGLGELLASIERLKALLAAEGLFAADRKKPLPFLPRTVGLVCGRGSDAEHDVVQNARRQWPAVQFEIRQVAVQGASAALEVSAAVAELDTIDGVDVIVITRGGGSAEDLLPFSNEALLRAVAACHTPVVSAIGHEQNTPLLDLGADVAASTPTDAAKLVVPDMVQEMRRLTDVRARMRRVVTTRLDREEQTLANLLARPALANPRAGIDARSSDVVAVRERCTRAFDHRLTRASDNLGHTLARLRSLSPAATLERGYSVVQRADGTVARDAGDLQLGERLRVRLAVGEVAAIVADPKRSDE